MTTERIDVTVLVTGGRRYVIDLIVDSGAKAVSYNRDYSLSPRRRARRDG